MIKIPLDKDTWNILKIIAAVIALTVIVMIFTSKGCTPKPTPTVNEVAVIEAQTKPIEDSLRQLTEELKDSITMLSLQLKKATTNTEVNKRKAASTINSLTNALAAKDTVQIIHDAAEVTNDFRAFVQATDKEDSVQTEIITTQEKVITAQLATIELGKLKFAKAADAYARQSIQLDFAKTELYKTQKKLKRAKFFNKVLGIGTAAGVALAAIIIL